MDLIPVWSLRWISNFCRDLKLLLHSSHGYGRSSVWTPRTCVRIASSRLNFMGHWEHRYGFSSVCITLCIFSFFSTVNVFSQKSHSYLGKLCFCSCLFIPSKRLNFISQCKHWYFFSPKQMLRCFLSSPCHEVGFTPKFHT